MKWIPIAKAKVKFGQLYLISNQTLPHPYLANLEKSETTSGGIVHTFTLIGAVTNPPAPVTATHIAIITEPNGTGGGA